MTVGWTPAGRVPAGAGMTIGARLGRTCLSVDVVRHRGLHKYLFYFEPF